MTHGQAFGWMTTAMLLTGLLVVGVPAADAHQGEGEEVPLWQWEPEDFQRHVATVRGGRDLTPEEWPDGNRVAVSFSFDVDTEPVWMGFQGQQSPSYMSRGEYGARVGMPRIMALLEKTRHPRLVLHPRDQHGAPPAGHRRDQEASRL